MATPGDMIAQIEAGYRKTASYTGHPAPSAAVLAAMRHVPRHAFVRPEDRSAAHENRPLPIGHGQTISQPYVVALMADLLATGPRSRVLEVGAGSGYAAAVLSRIAGEVWALEVVAELAHAAATRLARQGYTNVHVRHGDGHHGWPEEAPFDAILVSAATPSVPEALFDQLAVGGILVAPLGPVGGEQMLTRLRKHADGTRDEEPVLPVAFVPLVGR